jgi:hypothetical protein
MSYHVRIDMCIYVCTCMLYIHAYIHTYCVNCNTGRMPESFAFPILINK